MPPALAGRSTLIASTTSNEYRSQWTHPGDVFSVLLIVGADIIGQALAQLVGGPLTPVTFSFGWVAYGVAALVHAGGENKLMPPASEFASIVINGKNGYVRNNASWVIGRIVRDFGTWMPQAVRDKVKKIIDTQEAELKARARRKKHDPDEVQRPPQAGLCVTVYEPSTKPKAGIPKKDAIFYSGFVIAILQLGIAAIPCWVFDDWGILMITAAGITLAFISGSLPQWKKEKWAARRHTEKSVVLTKGNGSQHAIIVLGTGNGLDLEDLATSPTNDDLSTNISTKIVIVCLAIAWVLLLITASGQKENTWFLLAVGGIGMLQNIIVASWPRKPSALGIHLDFVEVIGHHKVMQTLYLVEEKYPLIGASMRPTFFPGDMRQDEVEKWKAFAEKANSP